MRKWTFDADARHAECWLKLKQQQPTKRWFITNSNRYSQDFLHWCWDRLLAMHNTHTLTMAQMQWIRNDLCHCVTSFIWALNYCWTILVSLMADDLYTSILEQWRQTAPTISFRVLHMTWKNVRKICVCHFIIRNVRHSNFASFQKIKFSKKKKETNQKTNWKSFLSMYMQPHVCVLASAQSVYRYVVQSLQTR